MKTIFCLTKPKLYLYLCFTIFFFVNCRKELQFSNQLSLAQGGRAMMETDAGDVEDSRPNIIIFVANDVGYEAPGFTGGHSYETPTLDRMAANGVFFTHTYRHPDGFPSRLALYTGKYNFRNYVSWGRFPHSEKTFANMLSDVGYNTCFVGKWQMNDGDLGMQLRGWQQYLIFMPFQGSESQRINRYKNPRLYEKGAYLPDSAVEGKYSEDMFSDYLCRFIDTHLPASDTVRTTITVYDTTYLEDNSFVVDSSLVDTAILVPQKKNPFLAVYSLNLAGKPFVPTPDDPEFEAWNPAFDILNPDKKYERSMVRYMDKMIDKILTRLQDDGMMDNTYVFYLSATAAFNDVSAVWGPTQRTVRGGKMRTHLWGTLNPLLVYCPAKLPAREDRSTLIDYTDFMPTLADLTGTPRPVNYGTLDGVSFADNLMGIAGEDRSWVFCHWDNDARKDPPVQRWVNDTTYKLYDTLGYTRFFNTVKDTMEKRPIPDEKLTPSEQGIKQNFIQVLQQMRQ